MQTIQTIDGVEFKPLPRGTMRGFLMPMEIDVWNTGSGWRWTITHGSTQHGKGFGVNFPSFEEAAQVTVVAARGWIHPVQTDKVTAFFCLACEQIKVDPEQGFDTCKNCNP